METKDIISLPSSSNSGGGSEDGELCNSDFGPNEADSQPHNYVAKADMTDGNNLGLNEGDIRTEECTTGREIDVGNTVTEECATGDILALNVGVTVTKECATGDNLVLNTGGTGGEECTTVDNLVPINGDNGSEDVRILEQTEVDMNLVNSPMQVNVEVADTITAVENLNDLSSSMNSEKSCLEAQNEFLIPKQMTDGKFGLGVKLSGVKRARMTYDEHQPSVHVTYNSLTRDSKRKLEELLQQWSEWHVEHGVSQDLNEVLESGEETFFPALQVGMEMSSAVSFWIENQKQQNNGFIPLDSDSVPLYDRGYALGLTSADGPSNAERGLEIVEDAARCFNCGSYSHSLKGCPKPRDNVAVNNARKQHKSKRNQNARNPTRYYENSSGGKYDGLKPGALNDETRQLLGLGELDPPPWLNRMRELGYPPGYLDADDEDQPSGIMIFGDGDFKEEQEDGEIIETACPEPQKKMSVKFPGINAPIPGNADKILWAAGSSNSKPFRNQSHHRSDHSSEAIGRWHHREERWYGDFIDDGPPGVDSPSASSYRPRHGSYNSDSFASSIPTLARSHSDRRRSTWAHDDFEGNSAHSSSQYSSLNKRYNGLARYENDDYDRYQHRSRR